LKLEATGSGETLRVRMLLPPGAQTVVEVQLNGQPVAYELETLGASRYAVVSAAGPIVQVQVRYR